MTTDRLWMTMEEAAEFLGVNTLSVRRRMMRGELPAHQINGDIRFDLADVMVLTIAGASAGHPTQARSSERRIRAEASLEDEVSRRPAR